MSSTEKETYIENYVICETDKSKQSFVSKVRLEKNEIVEVKNAYSSNTY